MTFKTLAEIKAHLEGRHEAEKLALIFQWVKTGHMTKNQFIALITERELDKVNDAIESVSRGVDTLPFLRDH